MSYIRYKRQLFNGGITMEMLYLILSAVCLGALHSLEPGHGKGVISAYLVSHRAKVKDAILLGMIAAIAHTLSIFMLALATSETVKLLVPTQLSYLLELISGIIISLIGAKILYLQIRPRVVVVGKIGHAHTVTCGHHHHHHEHGIPSSLSRLFSIGFFTGLIPCPSALAIFVSAIAARHVPTGMALVAAFSLGSAITMSAIGIVVIKSGNKLKGLEKQRFIQSIATFSAFLIFCLGSYIIFRSLQAFL